MTREDIECIIKWFSHIEQLATDGKTANGYQMPTYKLLATIKVVAKDSREYVEKFCNESTANGLEEAANQYIGYPPEIDEGVITAARRIAFKDGAEWQKRKMMEGAVECIVSAGKDNDRWLMTYVGDYESMLKTCKTGDKVNIIILPKEDEK